MSNTPPDFGRPARSIAGYLYPGGGNLDFSAGIFNTDHTGHVSYRSDIDPQMNGQSRISRVDQGTLAMNDSRNTRARDVEGPNRMRDNSEGRGMNSAVDDFNKLDNDTTALNVMSRPNDYDGYKNGYTADPMRTYPNSKNMQTANYSDRHYPPLQFLQPRQSVYHQPQLDPYNTMLSTLMKAQYDFNPYTRPNISPAYPGLGQSGSRLNPYHDFTSAEAEMNLYAKKYSRVYPSSPIPVPAKPFDMDPHLMSRYPRSDDIPGLMNSSSPRTHSVPPSKPFLGNITDISRSQPTPSNGVKHGSSPVIDLTSSSSPDNFRNPSQLSDTSQDRSHMRSSIPESRSTPKENGNHQQSGAVACESRNAKSHHHYPHSSGSPYSNLLPYPSAIGVQPYHSNHFNHYENPLNESRAFPKPLEQIKSVPNPWGSPMKPHNPSPRQMVASETSKKSSPSSQIPSKDVSRGQSEITFNYPEASSSKYDRKCNESRGTPSKRHTHLETYNHQNDHEKYSSAIPPRNHSWDKNDESKLTPYENHIMDSARDGKMCGNTMRNFDASISKYTALPRKNPISVTPQRHGLSPKHDVHRSDENHHVEQTDHDPARNSVIHSAPTPSGVTSILPTQSENAVANSNTETTPRVVENSVESSKGTFEPVNLQNFDQGPPGDIGKNPSTQASNSEQTDHHVYGDRKKAVKKRKTSGTKPGDVRVKRRYIKRSEVWNNKGRWKKKANHPNPAESISPNNARLDDQTALSQPEATDTKTVIPGSLGGKIPRPQRKPSALDMDEYLYGYAFSDEETENDDSSDEDYNCPSNANKVRNQRHISKPVRRTRRSTRSQDDPFSENEEYGVEAVSQKRRRRRKMMNDRNKTIDYCSNEKTTDSFVQDAVTEIPPTAKDIANPTTAEITNVNEIASTVITHEMAKAMVKPVDIVSDLKQSNIDTLENNLAPIQGVEMTTAKVVGTLLASEEGTKVPLAPAVEPRKKRKYTRKLDEYGNPVKRVRKIKSLEVIPKKRRKYVKKAQKWFKNKNPDQQQNQEKSIETDPIQHVCSQKMEENAIPISKEETNQFDTIDSQKENQHFMQGTCSDNVTKMDSVTHQNIVDAVSVKGNNTICNNSTASIKCDATTQEIPPTIASTVIPNNKIGGEVPVKIRKKPGRKPGWRKYPVQDKDAQASGIATAVAKLRKKYKNTGDGLKRFGRRKKSRRGGLRNKPVTNHAERYKLLQSTPITSTPTCNRFSSSDPSPSRLKRKYDNSRRLEKKRKRLLEMGITPEREPKKEKPATNIATRNRTIHEISLELQSQEYEFDSKDVSWHQTLQANEEDNAENVQNIEEHPDQQACSLKILATPHTPLSTVTHSPFPANLKKLTCNSAIGETALHKAARLGYVENIQYYLETGAGVDQCDNAGYTALHKACVHNNLDAASLLIQYGADVNKHAADGTRPFHDAVEYDNLEMARLMLACGADPMLSKFSGRAVLNMIRSEKMGKFMNAYLQELKESTTIETKVEWKFKSSSLFDQHKSNAFNAFDFAPESEDLFAEFELYEELPLPTYLLQPDDEHEWANFCLLDDYLSLTRQKKKWPDRKVRIITMPTRRFLEQVRAHKIQSISYEKAKKNPDTSGSVVEIVAVDNNLLSSIGAQVVRTPLFASPKKVGHATKFHEQSTDEHPESIDSAVQDTILSPTRKQTEDINFKTDHSEGEDTQ